jgi:hypothetical protein
MDTTGVISLGTVSVNQRFKMTLPLPASIPQGSKVRASATGLPTGVRVAGHWIGGRPKQAGTFTFTVQFKTATTKVSQQYMITVEP